MAIMTSRQAAEFDFALERNGWTAEDIKKASGGDILAKLLLVVHGKADVIKKSNLALVRKVRISAQPALTISKEYFKAAGIGWMSDNFKNQFLSLDIPAVGATDLTLYQLKTALSDASIFEEPEGKVEIFVSQFAAFLNAHKEKSEWFIFCLRGRDGNLWIVDAYWYGVRNCWNVGADLTTSPGVWRDGSCILSR